jgi:hypothetical protein
MMSDISACNTIFSSPCGGIFVQIVEDLFGAAPGTSVGDTDDDYSGELEYYRMVQEAKQLPARLQCVIDLSFPRVLRSNPEKSAGEMRKKICTICDLISRAVPWPSMLVMTKLSADENEWICRAIMLKPVVPLLTDQALTVLRAELAIPASRGPVASIFIPQDIEKIQTCQCLNAILEYVRPV